MSKRTIVFGGAFVLCLLVNLFKHNPLFIGILNSLVLILSFIFFEKFSQKKVKTNPIFIILLAFVPLFNFNPQTLLINSLQVIFILFLFASRQFSKLKFPFLIISLIILVGGLVVSNKINSENLIFNTNVYQELFTFFQEDAMYIPYKLRLLVYNPSQYLYSIITNAFKLFTPQNLYSVLLLANLYPLFYGFYLSFKSENFKKHLFFILCVFITLLIAGLNLSPDKFNSLYFSAPIFLYFILFGLTKVNTKIYSLLLLISLIIL